MLRRFILYSVVVVHRSTILLYIHRPTVHASKVNRLSINLVDRRPIPIPNHFSMPEPYTVTVESVERGKARQDNSPTALCPRKTGNRC